MKLEVIQEFKYVDGVDFPVECVEMENGMHRYGWKRTLDDQKRVIKYQETHTDYVKETEYHEKFTDKKSKEFDNMGEERYYEYDDKGNLIKVTSTRKEPQVITLPTKKTLVR